MEESKLAQDFPETGENKPAEPVNPDGVPVQILPTENDSAGNPPEEDRELDRLRRENEDLRRQWDTFRRAPVRGVTGGGPVPARPASDFERGFDADNY